MPRTIPLHSYRVHISDEGYQTHANAPLNIWCEVTQTNPYDRKTRQDVWSGYVTHDPARLNMLPTILESAFPRGMNGYPGLFVGDGYALCPDCGRAALSDRDSDADELTFAIDWARSDNLSGMTCDGCGEWICEPSCGECGRDESDLPTDLVYNDSGDRCVCRDCIAEALLRTREREQGRTVIWRGSYRQGEPDEQHEHRTQAHVIAPGVYELTNAWFAGTYKTARAQAREYRQWQATQEEK